MIAKSAHRAAPAAMRADIAVSVRGLSKAYTIAHNEEKHSSLAETALARLKDPLRRSKKETFWALADVSFDVKQGEVIGIIGRNGAGKSTLLKILSRITEPTSGRAELRGRVGSLLEVGTGFHPELSGRENIYLNGSILGIPRTEIQKQFDAIVDFSGVEQFLDTPVKRYSSGMYVRLAFAVAAHLTTEILIVDEVLAVGDAEFQKKCLGKMGEVASHGRTVLFVSHNMAAVRGLCNSAVLLSKGRVQFAGSPDGAISEYMNAIVPAGAPPSGYVYRDDRLGIALASVELLDAAGRVVPALQTGQPGALRMSVATAKEWRHVIADCGVNSIVDNYRLCILYSPLTGDGLSILPPRTDLVCYLPEVSLMPGRYRLRLIVTAGHQTLLDPPNIEFEVVAGDFFGTGKLPDGLWGGSCLMEQRWSCEQSRSVERH